jgi:RNA polymerase sigma factor (sigma-70 family)
MSDSVVFRESLHALYCEHHGWLVRLLNRKLGNTDQAADLAHDTFVRLMVARYAHGWHHPPRALLTRIAQGLVIDHWRRREVERAYLETVASLPISATPSNEDQLLILEALYRIDAMLSNLPSRTRRIFLMSQLDGMTYRQIAAELRVSLITVKRHMQTAFLACLSAA